MTVLITVVTGRVGRNLAASLLAEGGQCADWCCRAIPGWIRRKRPGSTA